MTHRWAFEALERTLRDLTGSRALFGGKVVVMGGDFRQVLPVVRHGSAAKIVSASLCRHVLLPLTLAPCPVWCAPPNAAVHGCISRYAHLCVHRSAIWGSTQKLRLRINMRVRRLQGDDAARQQAFADYLLRIGEGREPTRGDTDYVELQRAVCDTDSADELVAAVYGDLSQVSGDVLVNHCILAPKNEDADAINEKCVQRFPGEVRAWRAARRAARVGRGYLRAAAAPAMQHLLALALTCLHVACNAGPRVPERGQRRERGARRGHPHGVPQQRHPLRHAAAPPVPQGRRTHHLAAQPQGIAGAGQRHEAAGAGAVEPRH